MNPSRLTFSLGEAGRCHFAETNSFQLFVGILPGVSTACSDHLKTIKLRLGLSQKPSSADSERMGIKGKFLMGGKQHFCINRFVGTKGCSSLPLPGWPMGTCCFKGLLGDSRCRDAPDRKHHAGPCHPAQTAC